MTDRYDFDCIRTTDGGERVDTDLLPAEATTWAHVLIAIAIAATVAVVVFGAVNWRVLARLL
jgi:hypothetical protein